MGGMSGVDGRIAREVREWEGFPAQRGKNHVNSISARQGAKSRKSRPPGGLKIPGFASSMQECMLEGNADAKADAVGKKHEANKSIGKG